MTAEIAHTTCKVLLVDDEENIVRSIARLLLEEDVDLEVLTANSGAQGLAVLAAHPETALILADQRMPGMTGAEFLQKAREAAPDAVRMVLTGYADMAATMDAINKGGAWRYLTKPWDDEALRSAILEGVGQYRLLQENRALHALVEKQNRELADWNGSLKSRVMEQTATIRRQNEELKNRNQQIGTAFRHTLVVFSRLIEQYSSRLQEHTGNVTELSVGVAGDLGLPPEQIETIRAAALLHEIGVIGIAPEILDKRATAMTQEELGIYLQHAVRGQTAVDEVEELREAGVLIRHHHERYDGEGFPDSLGGVNIPLGSRIIAFADWVDRELEDERGEAAVRIVLDKAAQELVRRLDPALFPLMEPRIRALYTPERSQQAEAAVKELRPKQLMAGMLVVRNLYSGAGQLMLAKGTILDTQKIAMLVRQYSVDPPAGGICVSWGKGMLLDTDETARMARPLGKTADDGQESGKTAEPRSRLDSGRMEADMELRPKQLTEGMQITRNLYSGTGLLLLTQGTLLDAGKIAAVARYYDIDPPSDGIFVSRKKYKP